MWAALERFSAFLLSIVSILPTLVLVPMKNKTENIKNDKQLKKEIGQRFRQFRQAIGKSQEQLAQILSLPLITICKIESGELYPTPNSLEYLGRDNKIDLNWIIAGNGSFFLKKEKPRVEKPQAPDNSLSISIRKDHPYYEQYVEMMDLMQVPAVGKAILAKLNKLKELAVDEIEEFRKSKKQKTKIKVTNDKTKKRNNP